MEKLISMTDFVLEQDLENPIRRTASQMIKYGLFLKQELNIGMFVPAKKVNDVWAVLEEPEMYEWFNCEKTSKTPTEIKLCKEYQEAKENVLFEGFELKGKYLWNRYKLFMIYENYNESFANEKNIEWLVNQSVHEFTLTQSAKQKLGL